MSDKTTLLLKEAHRHYVHKNYQRAIQLLSEIIDLQPDSATAYDMRGSAYKALANYDEALSDYNQALRIDPTFKNALRNRGHVYRQSGLYRAARTDFENALGNPQTDTFVYTFIEMVNQKIENSA